ncbi:hypothetical protein TNCV_1736781 [Trichonephila clavipes]|nr:hypothetical protein TNCV_1736781 [Trichonephila clavipes]
MTTSKTKVFCVLRFAKSESAVTVQRAFCMNYSRAFGELTVILKNSQVTRTKPDTAPLSISELVNYTIKRKFGELTPSAPRVLTTRLLQPYENDWT